MHTCVTMQTESIDALGFTLLLLTFTFLLLSLYGSGLPAAVVVCVECDRVRDNRDVTNSATTILLAIHNVLARRR
jgi:hypothetical protein